MPFKSWRDIVFGGPEAPLPTLRRGTHPQLRSFYDTVLGIGPDAQPPSRLAESGSLYGRPGLSATGRGRRPLTSRPLSEMPGYQGAGAYRSQQLIPPRGTGMEAFGRPADAPAVPPAFPVPRYSRMQRPSVPGSMGVPIGLRGRFGAQPFEDVPSTIDPLEIAPFPDVADQAMGLAGAMPRAVPPFVGPPIPGNLSDYGVARAMARDRMRNVTGTLSPEFQAMADLANIQGERDAGGAYNRFGGNIGRVGPYQTPGPLERPAPPTTIAPPLTSREGPTSTWAVPGVGYRTGPNVGAGLPPVTREVEETPAARAARADASMRARRAAINAEMARRANGEPPQLGLGNYEPGADFRNRIDQRTYSDMPQGPERAAEVARVAAVRQRGGMRLTPEERAAVPAGTADQPHLPPRASEARAAAAQGKAAERRLRIALRRGTPRDAAMLDFLGAGGGGGGESSLRDAYARGMIYGGPGAAALEVAKAKDASERYTAEKNLEGWKYKADVEAQSALDIQEANRRAAEGLKPLEGENKRWEAADARKLEQMRGKEAAIREHGKIEKWPQWKIENAVEDYGTEAEGFSLRGVTGGLTEEPTFVKPDTQAEKDMTDSLKRQGFSDFEIDEAIRRIRAQNQRRKKA